MLNILLALSLLMGHPPRVSAYPWQLMVGTEKNGSTVWEEKERFLEGHDCAEEARSYRIAECVRDMDFI